MNKKTIFKNQKINTLYFGGIYGASVSGLALFCKRQGFEVRGSDISENEEKARKMKESKIRVDTSQNAYNVIGADAYIYTHALSADNPELASARAAGIPVLSRSELLGRILMGFDNRIGVCGTHGKSTVSAMITEIFSASGKSAESFIGAESFKINDAHYETDTAVFEACEYKRAFLDMNPTVAAVINIEKEHTDTYPKMSDALEAYVRFASVAEKAVLCADNKNCLKIAPYMKKAYFYSLREKKADMYGENIRESKGFYSFDAVLRGEKLFSVSLKVPGEHNVSNALCAALIGYVQGIKAEDIKRGLESYNGIKRRFEYIGKCGESPVFDDYAHHPSEIRCTLKAARAMGYKRIVCAFQPHTYSRTKAHFVDFAAVLSEFDEAVIADIYAARERNVYGVTSEMLAESVKNGRYIKSFDEIEKHLKSISEADTLILTMGAGRMNEIAARITEG